METIFKILLAIHIAGGTIGLLMGSINLFRVKGDRKHKLAGNIFFYSMMITASCALLLSFIHPNYFLFIVGIFTIYMVGTGKRYLQLRDLATGQKVPLLDWCLTYMMLIFGIAFIAFGIYKLVTGNTFGVVLCVFGSIGLLMVKRDFKNYHRKMEEQNYWLLMHLQRMLGGYIASLTAFLVVNNKILPDILAWLLPTILITPLIIMWSIKNYVKAVEVPAPGKSL